MSTPLSALSTIISSGIFTIESTYAKHGATFPSLDEPFQPGPLDEDEALSTKIDHVIAAAAHLIALIKPAPRAVVENAFSFYLPASLNVAIEMNIPEILREAGSQGLAIKEIGERCASDPHKIGRILRYLATNHIFKEVSPDVFANNRTSSVIDTGKSLAAVKADPISKHDNTSGIPALVGLCTDEMMKAGAYLPDNVLDNRTAASQELLDTPLSRAFGRQHFFEFLEKPENEYRFRRFSSAMLGTIASNNSDAVMAGFDWKALKEDALVVDVGGGIGSTTLKLLKAYPHLRYIVQDRPHVIADGVKFWEHEEPEAVKTGRVKLKAHDFFEPQPIMDASVFFMRYITHDWPDAYAKKILKQLRASAQSSTTLVLCDYLVPYAASSNDKFSDIPGAEVTTAPYPLLPNLGTVSNQTVMGDLQMMTAFNSQERTIGQFIDLVDGTGWKLRLISRSHRTAMTLLVFDPVTV